MKSEKMFYGNQYVGMSKWEVLKFNTRKFMKGLMSAIFVGAVILGFILVMGLKNEKTIYRIQEKEIKVDNLTEKVQQIKNETLAMLKVCESAGHPEEDGVIIFDTNNRASIGSFQFQKKTVQYYYESIYGKEIGGKEAVLIALDDKLAGQLAEDILFGTDNGWKNWINCTNKYDLRFNINVVSKLTK